KAPVNYSPFKDPRAARAQHKFTLSRMVAAGYLDESEVERIHKKFWSTYWGRVIVRAPSQTTWSSRLDLAPYFTEYVRQLLEASPDIGPERLYTAGLKVYTTLDLHHQQVAKQEMDRTVTKANKYGQRHAANFGRGGVD